MVGAIVDEIVGLDIGGANLKAAVWLSNQEVRGASLNFPMWKQPDQLAEGVRQLLVTLGKTDHQTIDLAITMTGELADCFATRREGVSRIIDQLSQVVSPDRLGIYTVDGRWFTAEQAQRDPWTVAASNWHALASWLAQWPPTAHAFQCGVLIDIGSTTIDILPVSGGRLATGARTDRDRLEQSQLLYSGMRRTPICAVLPRFVLDGVSVPVMAELFATSDDAYVCLGLVDEAPHDVDSADGRPRTKPFAAARLARMIGEDAERLTDSQVHSLAQQVINAQATQLAQAIKVNLLQVCGGMHRPMVTVDLPHLICSGHGLPLFEQTIRTVSMPCRVVRLNEHVDEEVSRSAPAAAVAWLRQNPRAPKVNIDKLRME